MARRRYTENEVAERREALVDAAMTVFEAGGGIAAVSFRNVAAKAGCSYSAPYRYFTDKADLLNAMRARAFRWIEQEMKLAIEGKAGALTRLEALARAYIAAGLARPERYELMFFEIENTSETPSLELKAAKRDALDVCTQVIAQGQADKELQDQLQPLTASHLFWSAAHGLVSLEVAGQFVMGRKVDELIGPMLQTLAMQLAVPQSSATPVAASSNAHV